MIPERIRQIISRNQKDFVHSQVMCFDAVVNTLSLYSKFYAEYEIICHDSIIRLTFSKPIPNCGIKPTEFFEETYDVPLRYLKGHEWTASTMYDFIITKYKERCENESRF